MTNDDNWKKMLRGNDCPAELLELLEGSESKWRKGVIKQFIVDHLWKKDVENKLKWMGRENKAIIALLITLVGIALKIAFLGGI